MLILSKNSMINKTNKKKKVRVARLLIVMTMRKRTLHYFRIKLSAKMRFISMSLFAI